MALLSEEFSSELLFHALELIDISELSSSSDEFERFSGSFSPLGVSSLESQYSTTPVQTNTNAKRRSSKSELERLRSDVQQLEKTLARVKSKSLRSNRVAPAPDGIVSVTTPQMASDGIEFLWMDMAVTQQRRRQQAEATNRLLKRSIAKQLKVAEYLEAMIARRTMVEDREASYDPFLSNFRHLQSPSQDDELVFANLLIRSQQLYASTDAHLEQAGLLLVDSVATRTQRKRGAEQGAVYETVSCSSVPFSVQQTDHTNWEGFSRYQAKNRSDGNSYVLTEDGLRKNYLSTYQHLNSSYDLHSRTVMRKYDEEHRIVYAWTTVTVLASKGLRFYAQSLVVLEPSSTLPESASVMKKWLRLGGEQIDHSKVSPEAAELLTEGILKALSEKTVATWSWMENNLLGEPHVPPPCVRSGHV